jgi:hypothetical protein
MADRTFDVKIAVEISAEGKEFSDYQLNYHGLDYAQLQTLQHTITDALLGLGDANLPEAAIAANAKGKRG